eukprot:Rmarinus@m.11684
MSTSVCRLEATREELSNLEEERNRLLSLTVEANELIDFLVAQRTEMTKRCREANSHQIKAHQHYLRQLASFQNTGEKWSRRNFEELEKIYLVIARLGRERSFLLASLEDGINKGNPNPSFAFRRIESVSVQTDCSGFASDDESDSSFVQHKHTKREAMTVNRTPSRKTFKLDRKSPQQVSAAVGTKGKARNIFASPVKTQESKRSILSPTTPTTPTIPTSDAIGDTDGRPLNPITSDACAPQTTCALGRSRGARALPYPPDGFPSHEGG